mmetsp:Transcript_29894/g.38546  ORF Transcript_29894/g.38546 Transcript_29894/m.38546 type:complete len:114 (-) Transcript_29894:1406-1747(-)|eukprot:scaffold39072_cov199-Skeletonema_marinoi.AAC.2
MKTVSHLFLLAAIICFSSVNAFVSNNNGVARKSSQLQMTILSAGGKKADFKEGSPLKNACAKLGVKPKYSCKKGDCGSCTVSVGGSRIKACVGKVPPMPRLKSLQEKGLEVKG